MRWDKERDISNNSIYSRRENREIKEYNKEEKTLCASMHRRSKCSEIYV